MWRQKNHLKWRVHHLWDRRPPTPKKFSHRFFTEKMGFESIMVTSRFFDVSRFVFQKSPAQTAKWTFIWTLDTLPYLPQSPHHKYARVSVYETIYRNVQFTILRKSTNQKPGVWTPKTGGVTFESTESSILGDQILNEIFSAIKSFKHIRWFL